MGVAAATTLLQIQKNNNFGWNNGMIQLSTDSFLESKSLMTWKFRF